MFWSVTVDGSSALLNVIVTVRPLTVVAVIVGAVTSARVNVIGPEATRSLPSSDDDRSRSPGSGSRRCRFRWPVMPGRLGEAERELDDRRVGGIVDGDRRAHVDRDARGHGVKVRSAAETVEKLTGLLKVTVMALGVDGDGRAVGRVGRR